MIKFEIDPFRKQVLLNGWDDIALTLRAEDKITTSRKASTPRPPGCRSVSASWSGQK